MSRKELPRPGLMKTLLTGRITNQHAAAALHVSVRQVQRLKRRFEAAGAGALRHGSRGRPSPRRLPDPVREQIQALMQTVYEGFNDSHLTEKLRELHSLSVSRESVRRLRRALGRPPDPPTPRPGSSPTPSSTRWARSCRSTAAPSTGWRGGAGHDPAGRHR